MAVPLFSKSPNSPLIIVRKKREPLIIPREILNSHGHCLNCGRPYGWRVRGIDPSTARSEQEFEEKERAWSLWLQYRKKGWCDRCVPEAHRKFIAAHCSSVVYY